MKTRVLLSAGVAMMVLASGAHAQRGAQGGEWRSHSADSGMTKYSALDQINKGNVSQLRIAWRRPAVDASIVQRTPGLNYSKNFHATPIMVDGNPLSSAASSGGSRTVELEQVSIST